MLSILLISLFLLSTVAPESSPLDIAVKFQTNLNKAISLGNTDMVNTILKHDFYSIDCKDERVEKKDFPAYLISGGHQGEVTGARDDGYYIYYSVNYGGNDKTWVYLITSRVYPHVDESRILIFAKHIDCKFVE